MSYLVFARKFRPQTFDEVIGQEPIVKTLKNAIAKNRIAQSFLFTGSRGVGKTSTARIFAKALNCEKGISPEPCNKCSTCQEITEGTSLDILEIDGASNRGIDEIRNLRESVKFKPTSGQFKIYIIDEVHMLTTEAFNALLKTLEEPPEHVKFIFATTEAHKVPLTILSRCQRFNFKRIPTDVIASKLRQVAKQEKIKIDEGALFLIAKHSEGSLRDGESLLDQLASFSDKQITDKDVAFSLGLTGEDLYFTLLEALKARDGKKALQLISEVTEAGKDLVQFSRGFLELFRDLLVSQITETDEQLIEGTKDRMKQLRNFQNQFSQEELLFSLTLLQQLQREVRWSQTPRFLIEACLLKIANCADLRPIDEVLKELKSLEKQNVSHPSPSRQAQNDSQKDNAFKKKDNLSGQILGEAASMLQHMPTVKKEPPTSHSPKPPPHAQAATQPEGDESAAVHETETAAAVEEALGDITLNQVEGVWPDLLEQVKALKMSCGTFFGRIRAH